jgi:hypothetical protein
MSLRLRLTGTKLEGRSYHIRLFRGRQTWHFPGEQLGMITPREAYIVSQKRMPSIPGSRPGVLRNPKHKVEGDRHPNVHHPIIQLT